MFLLKIENEQSTSQTTIESFQLPTDNGLIWLHFEGEMEKACEWLTSQVNLDSFSVSALCHELTRPSLFTSPSGEIVITLRTISLADKQSMESVSIRVLMTETALVTLARVEIPAVLEIAEKLKRSAKGIYSPYHLLWLVCDLLTENITEHIAQVDEILNDLEDDWETQHKLDVNQLHLARLKMSRMRRFLSPQLEAFQKLNDIINDKFTSRKKEKTFHLSRWRETLNSAKRDIEALTEMQERVKILHDAMQQGTHESTNRIMYLLSVVATFFLPLTFVASLLGMNVNGIPVHDSPWGFWLVCGLMLIIALLQWLLFKYWHWLK